MGGEDCVVQVDECLLRGRRKNNKGRLRGADLPAECDTTLSHDNTYGNRIEGPWVVGLAQRNPGGKVEKLCLWSNAETDQHSTKSLSERLSLIH